MADITIVNIDPKTFEYQEYSPSDNQLIQQVELDTAFDNTTDYIEFYIFDQNNDYIYPSLTEPYLDYKVQGGDVLLEPVSNLEALNYDIGIFNTLYNFYRKRLASDPFSKYFISDISSDRTEIRLDSNVITNELIISSSNSFIQFRENADYFVDFYLNFGLNQTVIANNIKLEQEEGIDPTVLIKLYEPLPDDFQIKDELWVVEELSIPQAYQIDFPFEPIVSEDFTYIAGPNYNLNITQETSKGGESFSFNTLLQSNVTSSINQIKNLLNQKEININVNYENYSNFVHFSSAKTRLENFVYKAGLIESSSNELSGFLDQVTGQTINTTAYSESRATITNRIDNIIKNFDGYEYFLYFNSGSQYSYPKVNSEPPYILASTGSAQALNWVGSADPESNFYGGQALSASNFDFNNRDYLFWTIPEYLREDTANQGYELFVDMAGQYYDNVWLYTKDISNKFDADNRLEYGISKDLVADAIRDFSVKLYASNFNTDDLFTAFLGLTPSGSAFPVVGITGSIGGAVNTPTGFEYVNTEISASNDIVPLNDVQKQVYKRIYHNIPYLLKTKGTIAGIRALITSYGIPDTILRINEFGGKDRNESQDYDLKQNVFNYAFDTGTSATNYLTSSLKINSKFNTGGNKPQTIQLRFKTAGIPTASSNVASSDIRYSQSLWFGSNEGGNLVLEYTGSGLISGSYSGSTINPYDYYGTLKWVPAQQDNPSISASAYLPFFDGGWWSAQINMPLEGNPGGAINYTASLFTANQINGKIGFSASDSTSGYDSTYYATADKANLNDDSNYVFDDGTIYEPFSGSFQELRYWSGSLDEDVFFDYVVNPYSVEGNTINNTPDNLLFRADLGTQLDTASRTSIHPRVTGSAVQITQSFSGDTSDYFLRPARNLFVTNVEDIFQDQVPAGIKNRITNKMYAENLILAEAPYGFQTPTSSNATISSTTSDVLSGMESIQQTSFVSQSYTPNVNYLEVAFSPSDQINDDINAQLGYFNLGDYIGDPRFISSSLDSYPDLDRLRDAYFEKYIRGYNIVDFIRLIKFFDNSLFKMIKDFTPARTSLASGVVVKQHLLERNRQRPALATASLHDYSGSVVNLPKNYSSGSADQPQYATSGSAIYKFSSGPGGSFNRFNSVTTHPSGSNGVGPDNRFLLTQSWIETFDYGAIDRSIINSTFFNQSSSQYISASYKGIRYGQIHSDQSEFYNGIFSGSYIRVEDGTLNPDCEPYLNVADGLILYKPIYYSFSNQQEGAVSAETFADNTNVPPPGFAWIGSSLDDDGSTTIKFVKIAAQDVNGNQIAEYIQQGTVLFIQNRELYVDGVTNYGDHALININNSLLDAGVSLPPVIGNGGQEDFTLFNARGSKVIDGIDDNHSQGSFNDAQNVQTQVIFNWAQEGQTVGNVPNIDVQGFFNTGSESVTTNTITNEPNIFSGSGGFNIHKTTNTPLFFTMSIAYSASDTGFTGVVTSSGIYHSASYNALAAPDQGFSMSLQSSIASRSGSYIPTPSFQSLSTQYYTDYNANVKGNFAPWFPDEAVLLGSGSVVSATKPNLSTLAGHSQILIKGTSSLDFHFPAWEFSQQSTAIAALSNNIMSFSGSDDYPSIPDNSDFQYLLGGQTAQIQQVSAGGVSPTIGVTRDGSIGIKQSWMTKTAFDIFYDLGGSGTPTKFQTGLGSITAIVQYTLTAATGTNLSCSAFYGVERDPAASGTFDAPSAMRSFAVGTSTGGTLSGFAYPNSNTITDNQQMNGEIVVGYSHNSGDFVIEKGSTGRWEFTGSFDYDQLSTFIVDPTTGIGDSAASNLTPSDAKACLWIKPCARGFENSEVTYQIDDYKIILQWKVDQQGGSGRTFTSDTVFGGDFNWSRSPNNNGTSFNPIIFGAQGSNSTTPADNKITLANNIDERVGANVDVVAQLWKISGSGADIDGGGFNADQAILVTQSKVVNYTMTPGASTGGSGGKGGGGSPGGGGAGTPEILTPFPEIVLFPDSPIENILQPNNVSSPTAFGSTITNDGDMYFMAYSMSNYFYLAAGFNTKTIINYNVTDASDGRVALPSVINTGSSILISQSLVDDSGDSTFASGSLQIYKTIPELESPIGTPIIDVLGFNFNSQTETGRATVSGAIDLGQYSYALGDCFRMGVSVSKSFDMGITITEYSMSINNSSSIWAPFSPASRMNAGITGVGANNFRVPLDTPFVIPTYYGADVLPFSLALDCQPLLNNFSAQRSNSYLFDIDYNYQASSTYFSSSLAPVNFLQILSGSAVRAAVPESNYTELRSINPRYNGSRSTSKLLNVWNIGDIGTFGKNPTVELRDAVFGYFNDLDDPYPNINNLTRANLNYLIDEQGNALPPSLNPLAIATFEQVFPNETFGRLAAKSGRGQFKSLGDPAPIKRIMQYVTPIMYSQNAGNNYTNVIPLSGSGYISRYDNDDENDQVFSKFNALGETTVNDTSPQQEVDYLINPSDNLTEPEGNDFNPYNVTAGGAATRAVNIGAAYYPAVKYSETNGQDLPNEQIVTLNTSFVTSFISETRRTRDELKFTVRMYTGSTTPFAEPSGVTFDTSNIAPGSSAPFNLEDITCTVYTDDGRVTPLGSVLQYGWFEIENVVRYEEAVSKLKLRKVGKLWRTSRWKRTLVPVPTGGIICSVDWEMYDTLYDLGLMRRRKPKGGAGVKALEWTIVANSGVTTIKVGDAIRWRINGRFKNSRSSKGYQQGFFFPLNFDGQYTSANIEGVGAYDHLLDEANTAQAPFWVFTGSSGTGAQVLDQQFLVMSSSNMNEAYGTGFRQADLEYFPAPSPYFPGGIEPATTRFDNIEYPLEIEIGDEIRFGNNENFTYRVEEVFSPQQNKGTKDRANRLKIKLDRAVDESVNKDFFLLRRPIVNPNSLYLDTPFPYESLASASISTIGFGPGSSGSFALTGSKTLISGSNNNVDGSYTGSLSNLEIANTPGILYPDYPTTYLIESASIIVNDLISKGIIES